MKIPNYGRKEGAMKKFMNFLKRHAKKLGLFAGVSTVVALGAVAASAWGPDRPTYTVAKPADHITFNSIVDNPYAGDERNFVVVKDAANTNAGGWQDDITVQPDKEYLVRIYAHNNAASELNLTAVNTRVSASVPTTTGKKVPLSGFVSADNAQPQKVWDDISFNSDKNFNIAYIPGSARIYNNGYAAGGSGVSLSDSIVTASGALIGYNGPDGKVPGCFEYASYITFKVKPQFEKNANFEVAKTVSKHDAYDWQENVNVQPGDSVDFRIKYKNTGEVQQDDVVVKDVLPTGMSYVAGSTKLYNAVNPNGKTLSDNVTKNGVNIGSHAAGASSFVVFTAKVAANDNLPTCGTNTLTNTASVSTPYGTGDDNATVTVPKECQETPVYECTALKAVDLGNKKYRFTTTVGAENGATVNKYVYNFGDATEALNTTNASVEHQYAKPGQYVAKVTVMFDVNGEQKEVKDTRCETTITIPETPVTPPVTPPTTPPVTTIPSTGPVQVLAGIFGTSATAYGVMAWVGSRRALKSVK